MIKIFIHIAVILLIVYTMLLCILFFVQNRLIYFPHRRHRMDPGKMGLNYRDVGFPASDGTWLHGWFVPGQPEKPTLLFCHGNAGNISHRMDSLLLFNRIGLNVLIFDYHGYGHSQGRPGERKTYWDVEGAWKYLTEERQIPAQSIVLFGRSLGGAPAAYLATKVTPQALIVESTFTSLPDLAACHYPLLPARRLLRSYYPTLQFMRNVSCPVLIIHSRDDELIPFRHGEKIFSAAHTPKTFCELSGSHNSGFLTSGRQYIRALTEFLGLPAGQARPDNLD